MKLASTYDICHRATLLSTSVVPIKIGTEGVTLLTTTLNPIKSGHENSLIAFATRHSHSFGLRASSPQLPTSDF